MKLVDLDPTWLMEDGQKVGFAFTSPTNPKWLQTCFFKAGRKFMCCASEECARRDEAFCPHSQGGLCQAAGLDANWIQGCNPACAWTPQGDLDFATLTVTPSLDGSAGGLWHGHITNGQIVGGI